METETAGVRRGRKFEQVLEGARSIFLRDGFEGANVDDIARAAGVSKATLYSYFPDKRLLFMEMASRQCALQADEAMLKIDPSRPPAEVLPLVARSFLKFVLSEMGQRIFRICIAEADRFPDLGRQFYQSGPMTMRGKLVSYLATARDRGEVAIDDLELAADQFTELCKASLWTRCVFGVAKAPCEAEIARTVDGAVATFLARYGA
ncbi:MULTISPECIES: TetR/AcrR family transcriptional regulator [unclassified Salipiger]|uniref:TetR/AcrR family transcriptional regulator n=1 Tax=unclassified Salipiger TaxID=2640570 RepID=UPI0013B5F63A|nr:MULTISPECIES: TetR/AcrR family transcriptional regulator [unclassified Salipiger]NDV50676.1 TetR/AcrR family transcriptional regulator [Salipiger sp. PrR003]NDW33120.1 TetR/AcrR family transcriptional regulator [Salipiger sp. PrR007]